MLLNLALLAAALAILTAGAELLVRGAVAVAKRMGLSSFFIGLTIVGFGTSTPELCTALMAASRGVGDLAVGNVVGSNIFNLAVILGVTALISPIPVKLHLVRKEVAVVLFAAAVPLLALANGGRIGRWAGLAMVAALGLYLWRGYRSGRRQNQAELDAAAERELESEMAVKPGGGPPHPLVSLGLILAGLAMLVGGSSLLVQSASSIAKSLGVSDLVIGLTVVAAGTSMPELATSLVAAVRKQSDIAVGNVLGSSIFNIFGILGTTCVVIPQQVSRQVLMLDVPVMILASLACIPIMRSGARISRGEGAALLGGYAGYVVVLFAFAPGWFAA
ncbi:MAG: calcium/sodium antiporter [Phycisphaerales bacterium]|nr:calcium/sodium antiporter [Phycisphaerales bacterium]